MVAAQTMQLFSDEFTALRARIEQYVQEHRPSQSSDRALTLRDSEPVTYIADSSFRPRRARRLGGIVAGLVAALGLVLALSRTFAPPAPAGQAASGARMAPATPAPPAVATSARAPVVRVSVVAYPKHAQLLLDGHRVDNPFAQELAAQSSPHRLEASADGYEPSSQVVTFERDLQLVLELEKSARLRRTRGGVARPASTHVPQHADVGPTPLATQPARRSDSPLLPGQDLGAPSRTPRSIDEKDLYQ
jgi:hypothetical protein